MNPYNIIHLLNLSQDDVDILFCTAWENKIIEFALETDVERDEDEINWGMDAADTYHTV